MLQRSQQFVARGGFLQIAEGAGIERGLHLVVAGKRGKNQNARRRIENPPSGGREGPGVREKTDKFIRGPLDLGKIRYSIDPSGQ